jgi:hypothetical protein
MNVLANPLLPVRSKDIPNPESFPVGCGGTGRAKNVLLGTGAGLAGVVCQFRFVTVILADNGVVLPLAEALTDTVPPVTIAPDHVLLAFPLVTVLFLESVNFQLEKVAPLGAWLTLQVALLPRVTEEGQLRVMTFIGPLPNAMQDPP